MLGEATAEAWRDPSGAVALMRTSTRTRAGSGGTLAEFEAATGGRVALLTRFGAASCRSPARVIQAGDKLHVLVTDEIAAPRDEVAEPPPKGAH